MANGFQIDMREYEAAVMRAYNMGEIRRRDIRKVFADADKPLVKAARSNAGRSKKGMISKKYPSRSHPAGYLKKMVKFQVSKRFKLVYYVRSAAFYSFAYSKGHHSWGGNPFVGKALDSVEGTVIQSIRNGLLALTQKVWKNG